MHLFKITIISFILLCLSAPGYAQDFMFPDPVRITINNGMQNHAPVTFWDGSDWKMVYRSHIPGGESRFYYLRVNSKGKIIGKQKMLFGPKGGQQPNQSNLCKADKGFGLIVRWDNNVTKKADLNFYVFNKNGKSAGPTISLFKNSATPLVLKPYWTGVSFIIPYMMRDESNETKLFVAVADSKGKRLTKDIEIPNDTVGSFNLRHTALSPDGIAFVGDQLKNDNKLNIVFCKIDFEGNVVIPFKVVPDISKGYRDLRGFLWDGSRYIVATQEGVSQVNSKPSIGAISAKGKWQAKKKIIPNSNKLSQNAIAISNDTLITAAFNIDSRFGFFRMLNNKLKPVSPYSLFFEDNVGYARLFGTGNTIAFCIALYQLDQPTKSHALINFLQMPYKGKPNIVSFTGKKISYFGKDHVLLAWKVNGTDSVSIKAKGMRGSLSNEGIYIYRLSKKTTFKLTTQNAKGTRQAELTVEP